MSFVENEINRIKKEQSYNTKSQVGTVLIILGVICCSVIFQLNYNPIFTILPAMIGGFGFALIVVRD